MAQELVISTQFQFNKDLVTMNGVAQSVIDVSSSIYQDTYVSVYSITSPQAMPFGVLDTTTVGFVMVQNIGEVDVLIRFGASEPDVLVLKAGTETEPGGIFIGYAAHPSAAAFDMHYSVASGEGKLVQRIIDA